MITRKYNNSIPLKHFENLDRSEGVFNFMTTRAGGISSGVYASFNLGYTAGDRKAIVNKNRQLLAGALGLTPEGLITSRQSHTNIVRIVGKDDGPADGKTPYADAQITDVPGKCLVVIVADCVPILLYDPNKRIAAAVHAGWRGTVKRIAMETVRVMKEKYQSNPKDIIAGIGPSIGPCCYEVGPDVIDVVLKELGSRESFLIEGDTLHRARFDLWEANRRQLIEAGISHKNIENALLCTSCHIDKFYSYRKEKEGTGRMMAGIMLKG